MNITIHEHEGGVVAALEGKLDTGTAPTVDEALKTLVAGSFAERADGTRVLIVDCTQVAFISSAGLRVLLATGKALRRSKGELRISGLNEAPRKVFEISGFDRFFKVYPTSEAALQG